MRGGEPLGGFEDFDQLVEAKFSAQKSCLHSMAHAPTTPPSSRLPFQTMGSNEVFAINCYLGPADYQKHDRYMFVTDTGIKSLKLPKYFYPSGGDTAELPRNVIHFKENNIDYYIVPNIVGEPIVHTADQLPRIAQELGTSLNRIRNEYIKKYEDHLRSIGQSSAINLQYSSDEEVSEIMSCLSKKQQNAVKEYMGGKFRGTIPAYSTIVNDHNLFSNLPEAQREKYRLAWSQLKQRVMDDVIESNPVCQSVLSFEEIDKAFEDNWGRNKDIYSRIHTRFFNN